MSNIKIINRDPTSGDKEIILEIDPIGSGGVQTYSVSGKIVDEKASGVQGITVRAYHEGITAASNILLGQMPDETASTGAFIIYYTTDVLQAVGKSFADLVVKAFDNGGVELATSNLYISALPHVEIGNLSVSNKEYVGISEYEEVKTGIDPLISGVPISEITLLGIDIISNQLGLHKKVIGDYIESVKRNVTYPGISGEVFYGLFRYDLPYNPVDLIELTDDILTEALLSVTLASNNIIDPDIKDDIPAILLEFAKLRQSSWLIDPASVDGNSYIAKILSIAGIPESIAPTIGEREKFVGAYLSYGSDDDFWTQLETADVFDGSGGLSKIEKRDNVRRAFQIGVITQEHPPLVAQVYPTITNIEEIGEVLRATWRSYLDITGVGVPNVDELDLQPTDKENYADALMTASEKAFPTEMLRTFMSNDDDYIGTDLLSFLEANPLFDIKETSPRTYLSDNSITDDSLKNEIFELKRLWHLSSGYNKLVQIELFINEGLLSASQIATIGKRSFVKKYGVVFGDLEAERIYKVAVKRSVAATKIQTNYNPAVNNIGTQVFQDSPINQTQVDDNPSLDVLFGSQDYCACTHCQSSFSPAAYLVDLLTFLKQTDVYDDLGTVTGQTAWDVLQVRRPEFVKILLSCDNTNVTLPYIDLVNEVLEHQVATGNLERQTTRNKESLRIRPEHLNKAAYDKLFDATNTSIPWLLPFHLWNEEASAYLKLVNVKRDDIPYTLDGSGGIFSETASLISLNISSDLQTVLEEGSAFMKYYGQSNTASLQSVKTLLIKSGLTYERLLSLLEMDFVNPSNLNVVFPAESPCSIDEATLAFTSNEYVNLHRFERLRTVLNWQVPELDMVFSAFGETNITSGNEILTKTAGIKKLAARFKLSIPEVTSWYAVLSDKSYGSDVSQYDEVFLNPNHNTDANVIANFTTGTGIELVDSTSGQLDVNNSPVVIGTLRVKGTDLLLLINAELANGSSVDKDDLAHLYRVASFIHALGISVQDYIDLKGLLTGIDPLSSADTVINTSNQANPQDTLLFIHWFDTLKQSGFSLDDIKFLLKHEKPNTYRLDDTSINTMLEVMRGKLQTKLSEKGIGTDRTREDLINLFLIFMKEDHANTSIEIVDGVNNVPADINKANDFIDQHWDALINDTAGLKVALTSAGGSISNVQARRDEVFSQFIDSLSNQLLLADEVTQSIADNYDTSRDYIEQILVNELSALSGFLNPDFVFSTGDLTSLSSYQNLSDTIAQLVKITFCLNKLNVQTKHVSFVTSGSVTTLWLDLKTLPIISTTSPVGFDSLLRMTQAYQLEKIYLIRNEFSIIDLIQAGVVDSVKLSEGTGWDEKDIEFLSGSGGFNFQPIDYENEGWLVKLDGVFKLLGKLSLSAEQLSIYKSQDVSYTESQALQAAIKSGFSSSTWQNVAVEVRDGLRSMQRDALSAYLIGNNVGIQFDDAIGLYEYFLLDTEMAPCTLTSRIKLATSSVQLWVQRIRMDLEPNIKFEEEDLDEWEWRKNYRVWEAARKIFLYPENWIEPELRDDKSPFFQDLEDELLQGEVTMESTESAYLNYLTKLDDVAVLEISGIYREEDRNILHVFARTKNIPHIYYYRTQEDGFRWTAWQRLDLDIEGDHLIPVVFNRRPMIFWPIFSDIPKDIPEDDLKVTATNGTITKDVPNKKPISVAEVKLAYSEWKNNKWQPKKISKTSLISNNGFIPANHFFKILISEEGLRMDAFYHEEKSTAFTHIGGFVLNNCNSDLEVDVVKKTAAPTSISVKNAFRNNMKILEEGGNDQFAITERIRFKRKLLFGLDELFPADEKVILNKTPGRFKITYPVTGVDLLSEVPFFFEDKNRVFFVNPTEEVFERTEIVQLRLPLLKLRRVLQFVAPKEGLVNDSSNNLNNAGNGSGDSANAGGGDSGVRTLDEFGYEQLQSELNSQ